MPFLRRRFYDPGTANRRTTTTLGNGIIGTNVYDAAGQLTSITYKQGTTTVGDLIYAYDNGGRITGITGSLGNPTDIPPATPNVATYDAANKLTTWKGQTLSYDANGSMTAVPAAASSVGSPTKAMTYVWDAPNRLKEVKANGTTVATFVYDAFGRRQQKTLTDAGVTTSTITVHDGHNPVQERDGTTPATIKANVRTGLGMDEFMARSEIVGTTTTNRHFLTNQLGSVLALTDNAGAITKNYKYEPYGAVTTTGETSSNPYQYTGRENDITPSGVNPTGLYYYRARYYDPRMQRFVSEDPIGLRGGDNVFNYVLNDPIRAC